MHATEQLLPKAEAGDPEAIATLLNSRLDGHQLARFASSSCRALQLEAAGHPDTPPEALTALAKLRDLAIREKLLERPQLDEAPLVAMAESDALYTRILERPDCPVSLILEAADSNEPLVQRLIAAHTRTPPDVLDALTRRTSDGQVEELLWARVETDPARLPAFADALDPELRTRFAQHPAADPEHVVHLAEDPDEDVRAAVAGRPDLPWAFVRKLAHDRSREVSRSARRNPQWRRRRLLQFAGLALLTALFLGAGFAVAAAMGLAFTL